MRKRYQDTREKEYFCKDCARFSERKDPEYDPDCLDLDSGYTDFIYGKIKWRRKSSVRTIRAGKGNWPCKFKSKYVK